jgi:hypothetical protein
MGLYCPLDTPALVVTKIPLCPAGRYGNVTGQSDAACVGACPPGMYCSAGTAQPVVPCPSRMYCPQGTPTPLPCRAGYWGLPGGHSEDTCAGPCPPGYLCPQQTGDFQAAPCPAGMYCPTQATLTPTACTTGHYCPQGTAIPVACPVGTYGATQSLQTSACSGPCPVRFWCLNGTSDYSQLPCPAGHYCTLGTITPQLCRGGYICSAGQSDPTPQQCGSRSVYCPTGSSVGLGVDPGFYGASPADDGSPSTTQTEQLVCPVGSYCDGSSGLKRDFYRAPSPTPLA